MPEPDESVFSALLAQSPEDILRVDDRLFELQILSIEMNEARDVRVHYELRSLGHRWRGYAASGDTVTIEQIGGVIVYKLPDTPQCNCLNCTEKRDEAGTSKGSE